MSGTIGRAASWANLGIPNFPAWLADYNAKNYNKVDSFVMTLQVVSGGSFGPPKVDVTAVDVVPAVGTATQILPDLFDLIAKIKDGVPKYFAKYPETINDVASGTYTATYKIPVPEGTGISNRQR